MEFCRRCFSGLFDYDKFFLDFFYLQKKDPKKYLITIFKNSMKRAIIYKSFLGSTKQYAQWLAEDTQSDIFKFGEISDAKLKEYDQIVVMSGTYASFMPLVKFLKKKWPVLKDKKVIVAAVGCAPIDDPMRKTSYDRIPEEIRAKIEYVKVMGATPFANAEKKSQEIKKENLGSVLEKLQ